MKQMLYAGLLAVAVPTAACNELPAEPITFVNDSDHGLTIFGVTDDGSIGRVDVVAPQSANTVPDECVGVDLQARLDDSTVVSTRSRPFCQGDPEWIITQEQVDAATGQP